MSPRKDRRMILKTQKTLENHSGRDELWVLLQGIRDVEGGEISLLRTS